MKRQYIFAGATNPLKIFRKTPKEYLRSKIRDLCIIESEGMHQLGKSLNFNWIPTEMDQE